MLATIDRYILGQVLRPMLAAILITLLALLAERALRVIDLVLGWRGSLTIVFEMMSYLVPHYMVIALPAALFLGIMLGVSRMSREGELDAMRAAGIGLWRLTRPLLLLALLVLALHFVLVSYLQPFSRYAYRAAAFAVTNASFQTLLRPGQFITIGKNTYRVEALSPDGEHFEGIFLYSEADAGGAVTVTAAAGQIENQGALVPLLLHLENGVQQFVPYPPAADSAPATRAPPLTLRFGSFTSDLSGTEPRPFRPRGEHERELTLPELVGYLGWPAGTIPGGIDPWEIEAELSARLVRNLSIIFLPLLTVPLAAAPRRAKRSYGFIVGVLVVVGYSQLISTGELLADDRAVSALVGIWLPFVVYAVLTTAFFVRSARRVPDPGKSSPSVTWIDAVVAAVLRRLPGAGCRLMVLTLYLNRVVAIRVAAAITAVILFALLFDLLDASDDLIRREGGVAANFAGYFALRFPSLLTEILPFAALLGGLFAASELMRNGELTIVWASGISPLGIIFRLLPICLLVLGVKLVNDDLLVPGTVKELRTWNVGFFRGGLEGFAGEHVWIDHAGQFIRLPRLEPDQMEAHDILILTRDANGNLVERLSAERAVFTPGAWQLFGVERGRVGEGRFVREPVRTFANSIDVDRIRTVARPPQEVALVDLVDIVRNDGYGVVTTQGHVTAIYHRLFGAALPMLMIMLCFAFARRVTRQGGIARLFLKGIVTGFSFVILSGLTLALAEAGFIGPFVATAGPVLLLAGLVVLLPLRDERRRWLRHR